MTNTQKAAAEKALADLKRIAANRDIEAAHGQADQVLLDLLSALGHADVVAAYDAIEKWYA